MSFDFYYDEDGTIQLRDAVFQALGAASMCWTRTPQGVFKDTRAKEIGEALLDVIASQSLNTFFDDVKEFHRLFNLPVGEKPEFPEAVGERLLRLRLVAEEFSELRKAHVAHDLVEVADAIADLIYVACGMAVVYGIPLNEIWEEVQRTNMAKGYPEPRYREDGKVLKPEGWTPPDIEGVLYGRT